MLAKSLTRQIVLRHHHDHVQQILIALLNIQPSTKSTFETHNVVINEQTLLNKNINPWIVFLNTSMLKNLLKSTLKPIKSYNEIIK